MSREEWIDYDLADGIRELLNDNLRLDRFQDGVRDEEEEAALFFQEELFDRLLGFDRVTGPTGQQPYRPIPVYDWPKSANTENAYLLSEKGNFRVIYVELESLTRTAERNAVSALTNTDRLSAWALEGNYLAVFHERDSDIWHLVTPYEEEGTVAEGRSVLRRFTIGEGENHRTVSENLSGLTATRPGVLSTRIDEAFRVRPVTEDFYDDYRHWFNKMENSLFEEYSFDEDQKSEKAHRYAHLTLNRLMFFYFLQNKQWLGGRKNFVRWFHRQYQQSDDTECFHSKWIDSLFFEGMNTREGTPPTADFPDEVKGTIADLSYMNGGLFESESDEERNATLPDSLLSDVIENFLEQYNFTVTEESPYDVDVAVDPAMLGKIYESLIAEEERDEAGIFYTPRAEVDLMCRTSIYEQLEQTDLFPSNEELVEFLFSGQADWELDEDIQKDAVVNEIRSLKIVDPAVGSGAFLVGMKRVVEELYQKLEFKITYEIKKEIVDDILYGVDIKEWAVRVAELRLWLSLVENQEKIPDERPVLPNFEFKLRVGDSIQELIEGTSDVMMGDGLSHEFSDQVTELQNWKAEYFDGSSDISEEQIYQRQMNIVREAIDSRIEEMTDEELQVDLTGNKTGTASKREEEIEYEIKRLNQIKEGLQNTGTEFGFSWSLDFADVILNGGFDIVISNPPYVRRERLVPQDIPGDVIDDMTKTERRDRADEYVNRLSGYVENRFGTSLSRWSDLYVYFFFRGFDILRENGTLTYVTSNSWLGVNFGDELRKHLLKNQNLRMLIQNDIQRTFEDASVNTTITICNNIEKIEPVKFISFIEQYESAINQATMLETLLPESESDKPFNFINRQNRKTRVISQSTLWQAGGGSISESYTNGSVASSEALTGSYDGDKWMKYLRAPDVYFEIDSDDEFFTTIGGDGVGEVNTALMTGANPFFILPKPGESNRNWEADDNVSDGILQLTNIETGEQVGIQHNYWMREINSDNIDQVQSEFDYYYQDDSHSLWVPSYIMKSSRNRSTILTAPKELDGILFWAEQVPRDDLKPGAEKYVEWGKDHSPTRGGPFPDRKNTGDDLQKGNSLWYDVEQRSGTLTRNVSESVGDIIWPRAFYKRLFVLEPTFGRLLATDSFYAVQLDNTEQKEIVSAQLNSSLWLFIAEIRGRVSLGEGALTNMSSEVSDFPIINPEVIDVDKNLREAYHSLRSRKIGTVFEEFGATTTEQVTLDSVKDDRRELDSKFMGDILGLDEEEQLSVYQGLLDLIGNRVEKSESV